QGITAFVLKYRLIRTNPAPEMSKMDSTSTAVISLAMQDGLTAMKFVRQNSERFGVDPSKIGFMGFSAGGTVTMCTVHNSTNETRPNFVILGYSYAKAVIGDKIPETRTPIFMVVASDDRFTYQTLDTYAKWLQAGQPAELHVYEKGGHGFGTRPQNLPVDNWMEVLIDWLKMH
ncbi:MAG TPA: alpha/beta hydrolase fold domain-containing protein, partial [Chitinophagaceae bacterium]|nr:alpha/beta hydrolase fold domain-containing protein [Chitinophagaceae bacterium]